MNIKQKIWGSRIGKLVVLGAAGLALSTGGAVAATVTGITYPLVKNSVAEKQVVDGSLQQKDFSKSVNDKLNATAVPGPKGDKGDTGATGATGATGEQGPKGDTGAKGDDGAAGLPGAKGDKGDPGDPATDVKGGAQSLFANETPKTITNIGGTFSTRHTEVGTFTLPKGTWLVNLSAKFNRTTASAAGDPEVQPMLQIVGAGNYVTIMGNDIAPSLDADLTGSAVSLITVDADTTFTVNAFGYNSARGSQGSGEITVLAGVVAAAA